MRRKTTAKKAARPAPRTPKKAPRQATKKSGKRTAGSPFSAVTAAIAKSGERRRRASSKTAISPARRRRNPGEMSAAELSEQFHGRPATSVRLVDQIEHERQELAELGRLVELEITSIYGDPLAIPAQGKGIRLAATPAAGNQLYFVGGDQLIDLAALGIDADQVKDLVPVAQLDAITYATRKAFHNFEKSDYRHEFGEVSGIKPLLVYDTLNARLLVVGGNYQVRPEGITD